jgi:hypothetical protein
LVHHPDIPQNDVASRNKRAINSFMIPLVAPQISSIRKLMNIRKSG